MKLVRPTKEMMLAINAQLDGKTKEAESLISEHRLNRKEMELRIEKRGGQRYELSGGKRGGRGKKARIIATASAPSRDILTMIDGRTKTATLARLETRISELFASRDKSEVAKVRDAVKNVAALRRQLQAAESILG